MKDQYFHKNLGEIYFIAFNYWKFFFTNSVFTKMESDGASDQPQSPTVAAKNLFETAAKIGN